MDQSANKLALVEPSNFNFNTETFDTNVFQNKTEIIIKDFGHCDILDQPYNNYMHTSFSEGNEDRDILPMYKSKIVEMINLFINNNLNEETLNATFSDSGISYSIE